MPSTTLIHAIQSQMPPFMRSDPEFWILRCEAIFDMYHVRSQQRRYSHLMSALPEAIALEVRDFFEKAPDSDPYSALRQAIIDRTAISDQKRIKELLSEVSLGDRTPSQLLRHMKHLAGNSRLDNKFLKELWLQRLPENLRSLLSIFMDNIGLEDLAVKADRAYEHTNSRVLEVREDSNETSSTMKLLSDIQQRLANLEVRRPSRSSTHRPRSNSRPVGKHSRSSSRSSVSHDICWFHATYGDKARRCRPGCQYKSGKGQASK